MRGEDGARRAAGRLAPAREHQLASGGENPADKYRGERTRECRQKSPNDQLRREPLGHARLFPGIPADF